MNVHTLTVSILALAVAAAAQTTLVVPAAYDLAWGQSSTSLLGGNSTRTQIVYHAPFAAGTTVNGISFRCAPSTIDRAAFTASVELRASSGPNAPGALDPTFANNIGSDEVVVLPQQTIAVPAMPANRGTGLWLDVPFAVPFVFGMNGNVDLVVEVRVFSRSAGASWSTDRVFGGVAGVVSNAGIGCGTATINSSSSGTASAYVAGSAISVALAAAPPSTIALLVPTLDQKEFAPGLPLPLSLTLVGAGAGCDLLVRGEAGALAVVTDGAGAAAATINVAGGFATAGLGFQWLYFVTPSAANPFGLATTPNRSVFVGPRVAVPDIQYVYDLFAAASATGTATVDACPITRLMIQ